VESEWISGRKRYNRPDTYPKERMKEQNITAFYLFVDFKSAFDSVIRDQLYATMSEMGIPIMLVKLTRAALKSIRSRVKI
jgi:sorting nexin-29